MIRKLWWLKRLWKGAVVAYLRRYLHIPGRAEENHDVIQDSLLPGWNSKWKSTTYKSEASPYKPPCSLGRPLQAEGKRSSRECLWAESFGLRSQVILFFLGGESNCVQMSLNWRFATRLASVLSTVAQGTCSSSESRLKLILRPCVFSNTFFNFPLLWIKRFFVI
jgi:hypothetical protein